MGGAQHVVGQAHVPVTRRAIFVQVVNSDGVRCLWGFGGFLGGF